MAPKKKSTTQQSNVLPFLSKSKHEFTREYQNYDEAKKRELYCQISHNTGIFIAQGNLDMSKKHTKLIQYMRETKDKTMLEDFQKDDNNPLRNTNLVILACKHNQVDILNHILELEKNNDRISPNDKDEANHNGFYYAIRSSNTTLLDVLVDRWPGNYFADNPQALDDILSQAYEELKLKNVPLSEEMEFLVESKLINLRFFLESENKHKTSPFEIKTIVERIELVIENVHLLRDEFLDKEKVHEKFLFVATFIAQNIHILKQQLRSTYDRLPWEEIEFCLICYIASHIKQDEIILFYRAAINKTKMISYLEHFARLLEQEKGVICKTENTESLAELPFMKREKVVTNVTKANPQFKELYSDYHSLRDMHSLQKINNYIKLALSADPNEKEGQLIITRVLQVIGEYLKNTLESPKMSVNTSELLLLSLPKNTRQIVVDLRDSLSHGYDLSKRNEIQENKSADFYSGVQNDTKKIGDGITNILFNYKLKTIKNLLNKIINSESINDIKEVTEVLGNAKLDLSVPVNFESSDHEKIKTLLLDLKKCIPSKSNYEINLFKEFEILLSQCAGDMPEQNIQQKFRHGFASLEGVKRILRVHMVDENLIRALKFLAETTMKNISSHKIKPDYLEEIFSLVLKIFICVKVREQSNVVDQVIKLICEIVYVYFTEMEQSEIKLIEKLRDELVENNSLEISNGQKLTFMSNEDSCNKQLTHKFSELKDIMKKNGLTKDIMKNISMYKGNEKLQAAVEMLVLDIMSILGVSKKYLVNNFLFSDNSTPLLTGKSLRNHLAHSNNLVDILLPNPTIAILVNAEKLTCGHVMDGNKKMGKLETDDLTKLKERFNMRMVTVVNQGDLFVALEEGKCEVVKGLLTAGADMHATSITSGWTTLHFACKGHSLECVKFVLDHNIDANAKDINGHTPFQIAAKYGRTNIVKFLIEEKNVSVDYQNRNGQTALHIAARKGHVNVVEVLLTNGANTQIQDKSGHPALLLAIANSHVDVFKILWQKDSSVEAKGGFTALHKAADSGNRDIVNFLLDNKADVNSKNDNEYTPLHGAAFNGYEEIVQILISKKADVRAKLINGCTPLHYAIENGHEGIAAILINSGADVNAGDKSCITPLHYAAMNGHTKIVELLIKNKANVNASDINGATALHRAAYGGHSSTVQFLLSNNANPRSEDFQGRIPLISAVDSGDKKTVEIIMLAYEDQGIPHSLYDSLLHKAVLSGHEEVAKLLLKKGANVDNIGADGKTPLHLAAFTGNKCLIDLLLEYNASVGAKTTIGNSTPLHIAAAAGQFDAVELLLKYNSNIKARDHLGSLLHSAVYGGNKDVVSLLLQHNVDVNIVNNDGISPLHLAVQEGHREIVKLLIDSGVDMNLQNKKSNLSPLLIAVKNHDEEMVKLLIENGAIVHPQVKDDCHPLHIAIACGNRGIANILLNTNISVNMRLSDGTTFLHLAAKQGDKVIVNELISKGAIIDAETVDCMTPLGLAIIAGHRDVVDTLITHGANINTTGMGNPLLLASERGHDDIVKILLEKKANYFGEYGEFIPLEFAVYRGHSKVVKVLLQQTGIDVNNKGKHGDSLLHIASEQSNLEIVKLLVEYGADIYSENEFGSKPIHMAAKVGFKSGVMFFLNKGMDVNESGTLNQTPLHYATVNDHVKDLEFLITQHGANIHATDDNGFTPLHMAAQHGHVKSVEALLKHGADYTVLDNTNKKPVDLAQSAKVVSLLRSTENMFEAVKTNNRSQVEKFIKAGAFIDAKRGDHGTALHFAASKGYDTIAEALLENKANINSTCKNDFTPLHYAVKFSHETMVKTLLANGAVYEVSDGKPPSESSTDGSISKLFDLIRESFKHVKEGNSRLINNLTRLNGLHTVKAIMGARNKNGETLVATAVKQKYRHIDKLLAIHQGDIVMQLAMAEMCFNQGDYKRAVSIFESMYERRKNVLGPDNPGTLSIQKFIAKALYAMGSPKDALNMIKEIYRKQREELGIDFPETLSSRAFIGLMLNKLERNEEALPIYLDVYKKQVSILGQDHSDTLNTQFEMALVLDSLKKHDEALEHTRMSYEKWKTTLGKDSPYAIMAMNNIAMILSNQGKYEEALKIYRDVLEKKKRVFGKDHLSTLRTLSNIPAILMHLGNVKEALEKYQEIFEIKKRVLGPHHPETLLGQYSIGNIHFEKGKFVSALKSYKQVYDQLRFIYGPNHSVVIDITGKLTVINKVFEFQGTDTWEVMQQIKNKMNIAAQKGDIEAIESLLKKGVDINDRDVDGRTPLHYAVNSGKVAVVKILLKNGADVTQSTNQGNTPLHTATNNSNRKLVDILLDHARTDQLIKLVNAKTTGSGTTALHLAAKNNAIDVVQSLLKRGAIYNAKNRQGKSPVHLATEPEVVHIFELIEDMFTQTKIGNVDIAAQLKEVDSETLLAVTNARNDLDKTILQVAMSAGHKKLVKIFFDMIKNKG